MQNDEELYFYFSLKIYKKNTKCQKLIIWWNNVSKLIIHDVICQYLYNGWVENIS